MGVWVCGRAGASGASENVDRFSRTANPLRTVAVRAAGNADRTSARASAISASLLIETMLSAPLEIIDR